MKGIGTLVDVLAIVVGGGLGVMFRGKLRARYQEIILQGVGLAALMLGVMGFWDGFFVMDNKQLEVTGSALVVFALLVGTVFGEAFRLDRAVDRLGHVFRRLSERDSARQAAKTAGSGKGAKGAGAKGAAAKSASREQAHRQREAIRRAKAAAAGESVEDEPAKKPGLLERLEALPTYDLATTRSGSLFVDGFAIATVLCAFSAMAFTGSVAEGLEGAQNPLFIKAAIDAVLVFALATVYGSGPTCAALPVLLVQGLMTVIAVLWGELLTPTLVRQLSLIASVMMLGMGINLCFGRRWRIINILPALLVSPIYGLVLMAVEKFGGE